MDIGLIIVAAGSGTRMGGSVRKPFRQLGGKMVIEHTLAAIASLPWISDTAVVLSPSDFVDGMGGDRALVDAGLERVLRQAGATVFTPGGSERLESVINGMNALPDADLLLIHDGVRPFVTAALAERVRDAAIEHGCAVPGISLRDTVRFVDGDGMGAGTPDRSKLRAMQTPQGFRREVLVAAIEKWRMSGESAASVTDEAMLVERNGGKVAVVVGDPRNIKLTEPGDLEFAEYLLGR